MKKLILIALVTASIGAAAQTLETNGTIYKKHPYISAMESIQSALVKGDTVAMFKFYADTVHLVGSTWEVKGKPKMQAFWHEMYKKWDVVSIKAEGYPDGFKYTSDPFMVAGTWGVTVVNKKTKKKVFFAEEVLELFNAEGKISVELLFFDTSTLIAASK